MMNITVVGATGFIGSNLLAYLVSQGHQVHALARHPNPSSHHSQITWQTWQFSDLIPVSALKVDAVIYLAYDFNGIEGAIRTEQGIKKILDQFSFDTQVKQIFFSTYSAGPHAHSVYGKTKFAIEKLFERYQQGYIIRPGLVLGDGGIYRRVKKAAQTLPLVPLPDGGRGQMPVIDIKLLCQKTVALCDGQINNRYLNLFLPEMVSLKTLTLQAAEEAHKRPWILPIPGKLLLIVLKIASYLHLPMPVNADNLAGFLGNQSADHVSSLVDTSSSD